MLYFYYLIDMWQKCSGLLRENDIQANAVLH
jgi:hypothetical protein